MEDQPTLERPSSAAAEIVPTSGAAGIRGLAAAPRGAQFASDGHLARVNGRYAMKKLAWLERYIGPALNATKSKPSTHYVDMFAGPGLNIEKGSPNEFAGSPMIAAQARSAKSGIVFDTVDAYNLDPWAHSALAARLASPTAARRATATLGDGVALATAHLASLNPYSYALVTLDIENPSQLPWSALTDLRAAAPRSTDAYILLPVGMAWLRLFPYNDTLREENAHVLTNMFGDESWRAALPRRRSNARLHRIEFVTAIVDAYVTRLQTLWTDVTHAVRVTRRGNQMLYYMVLATSNTTATKLARWAAEPRHDSVQGQLL